MESSAQPLPSPDVHPSPPPPLAPENLSDDAAISVTNEVVSPEVLASALEEDALTLLAVAAPLALMGSPDESGAESSEEEGEGEGASALASAVDAVVVEGDGLEVWEEGGRVWLSIPGDASLERVEGSLTRTEVPGGVLWLSLGARPATASEVGALCALVSARVGRPVAGVRCHRGALSEGVRRAVGVVVELEGEAPAESEGRGRQVLVVERTLRSGAAVRFRGDVLVYGDVNAGAEIEAGGNIIVLGALRGLAWAGNGGDETAMIISFDLRPVQLRIGRQIAFLPERNRLRGARGPEFAVVREGQIVLQEYRGRLSG